LIYRSQTYTEQVFAKRGATAKMALNKSDKTELGDMMSDSQRRSHAVKAKMSQLLPEQWAEWPSRLINLSLLISGIVNVKDLTQHALAAEMPVSAQDTSLAQRQRRWLGPTVTG
jgi:hypothetical protein